MQQIYNQYTTIVVAAVLPQIEQRKAIICVTNGHKYNTEKPPNSCNTASHLGIR